MTISSVENNGLDVAWDEITELVEWRKSSGILDDRRKNQALIWFQAEIENGLLALLKDNSEISTAWKALENSVKSGKTPPDMAAQQVLALFEK